MPDMIIPDHLMQWAVGTEASFAAGPAADPAVANVFVHLGADLGELPMARVIPVLDKTGTRTTRKPILGSYDPIAFKFTVLARGGETAATPARVGPFLEAGGFDPVGGVYDRVLSPSKSLWLWGVSADGSVGHSYAGGVVSQIGLSGGSDLGQWEFSGLASRGSVVYATTLAGAATAAATSLVLAAGHGWSYGGAPVWIKVGASSTVHKVTAFDPTTSTATITPAVPVGGYTSGAAVKPMVPGASTETALPIPETVQRFDLANGAEEVIVTTWGVTIQTGVDLRAREGNNLYRTGLVAGRPSNGVRITADLILTLDKVKAAGYAASLADKDVQILLGASGGRQIKIRVPQAKLEKFPPVEGADGARMGTMELGGYGNASGQDVTISFL